MRGLWIHFKRSGQRNPRFLGLFLFLFVHSLVLLVLLGVHGFSYRTTLNPEP